MNGRERISAILSLRVPDHMGLYEHFWGETIGENWVAQGYPEGVPPGEHFGYDIVGTAGTWFDLSPFRGRDETVEETDQWRVSRNGFGATLKHWKHKSGTPEHIDFDCATPRIWRERYRPRVSEFDPHRVDIETVRESYAELMAGDKFVVFSHLVLWEVMRGMLGDMVMLPALLLEPEWIHDVCETYARLFIDGFDYIFGEVGLPDGMFMYDDLGFSNGPYMSERTYREVVMPHHKQIFDFFHARGLPVIFHTCGDVRKLVGALADAGVDCLQPMEAKAGCDVLELAGEHGDRLAFMGNMDVTRLNTNDRDVIRAEVLPKLEWLRRNRVPYVFHSDHSIPPDVHYESYRYALELFRENWTYE